MHGDVRHAELAVSAEQGDAVSRMMDAAQQATTYPYPWDTLEGDLANQERSRLFLLGYGSLTNRTSAGHTLRDVMGVPAVAFGVRRIFNYLIPKSNTRYGRSANPEERAALNVVPTGRAEDMVNGVLIEVPPLDVTALRGREIGYDLIPVACIRWHEREEPPFLGHILHCPDEPRQGKVRTAADIMPHRGYYRVCREGAAEVGAPFLDFWLATTYLADGTTLARQWETVALPERNE